MYEELHASFAKPLGSRTQGTSLLECSAAALLTKDMTDFRHSVTALLKNVDGCLVLREASSIISILKHSFHYLSGFLSLL